MGTNYYVTKRENVCNACGRADEVSYHFGKSSHGWVFALHVIPEVGLNSLGDWDELLRSADVLIKDEYGGALSVDDLLQVVTERRGLKPVDWSEEKLRSNCAEVGPQNLIRSRVAGKDFVGRGGGTWDLFVGEFS